ncbi:hypothetical protein NUU61_003278 [Penicillium alfredii]|uniref:FAD dependent oxidoreductase domain-containing protein n=1 Tax=Penicillium alfredii TaxID=1506179 RepID=A0A9W9KHD4_9EURO|nr:uncharacterized protein NUU61_003278 [Penicillium alfredii]KAJ5105931.1 hypothetical protein NUU61_003278 [Penicillium alfredii]
MTAQEPGSLFPALDGTRSWSVIHQRGFDYISQRPGAGELLVGGGMVQSPDKGMDEFGVWRDDQSCYSIRAYLDGLLPTIFGAQNWGADRGESRVRMAWTGCMGFTPDLLPFVGRLDPKLTGRRLPPRSSGQAKQPAEWISAGFQGEGMVMAWLSGVAVGLMVIGDEDKVLEETAGIPAGKMSDWLPKEMVCSKRRVDGSSVSDLATLL